MRRQFFLLSLISLYLATGCAGVSTPTEPSSNSPDINSRTSHAILGYWQVEIDPVAESMNFIPLRSSEMHLNALKFLEPPFGIYVTPYGINFSDTTVECDVALTHPFMGLDQFTGFDVCGIVITRGSLTGFQDGNLIIPGTGDTRLLNPDGYSRWWNPVEFPHNNTMFSYIDGLMGNKHSQANYTATLNGYKYFADGLGPNQPISDLSPTSRAVFRPGQKNLRHYVIELGDEFFFNYAVDASWEHPEGLPPYHIPNSFPENANRAEAWNIVVSEIENTMYYEDGKVGGELHLVVNVFDWFDADLNTLFIEAKNGQIMSGPVYPSDGGIGFSTYMVEITDPNPESSGELDLLITVMSEEEDFQGFIPGTNTSAYFIYTTTVGDEGPPPQILDCGEMEPIIGSEHWEDWYGSTVDYRSGMGMTRSGDPYIIGRKRYADQGTWVDELNGIRARKETGSSGNYDYKIDFAFNVVPFANIVSDSKNILYFGLNINQSMVYTVPFDPNTGFGTWTEFAEITDGFSINLMSVDKNDNVVVLGRRTNIDPPSIDFTVFHWNGTGWDQTVIPMYTYQSGTIRDFACNPYNGDYVITCHTDDGTGYLQSDLVAVNSDGEVVHLEADIFGEFNHDQVWFPFFCFDPDSPDCRLVVWGCCEPRGFPTINGYRPIIRYDALYGSKTMGQTSHGNYDAPWGKGAYAPGTDRLYTGNSVWTIFLTWFNLPSDW
ncbi:MAG TPA: hypothetical protein ENN67_07385 [Firmicutes bacterium]|nr:hypothetical protein [Bacillota bacterium]